MGRDSWSSEMNLKFAVLLIAPRMIRLGAEALCVDGWLVAAPQAMESMAHVSSRT
jgi:hypothetical protein